MNVLRALVTLSAALVTLSAALATSAHPAVSTVWLDPAFSAGERAEIVQALVDWNAALGGHKVLTVCTDSRWWCDYVVELEPEHPLRTDTPTFMVLAWADFTGQAMHVMAERIRGRPDVTLRAIIKHEFGHLFGLSHADDAGTLMSTPASSQATCIDSETLSRLAVLRGWDARTLHPECHR